MSCKKEKPQVGVNAVNEIKEEKITQPVKSEDGVLVFENYAHLCKYLEEISKSNFESKVGFEKTLGFVSLGTIQKQIENEEISHQESFFAGVDPNLTVAEYKSMGLNYLHTDIFNDYLSKKVINKIIEKDGSWAFELNVKSPGFVHALNVDGNVIVGDKLYHFYDTYLEIKNLQSNEIVSVVNLGQNTDKMTSNWTKYNGSNNQDIWEELSSTTRIKYKVFGTCITSSNTTVGGLIDATFYAQALAQNKKFGSWAGRAEYRPIYSFSGSWTSKYSAQQCFTCPVQWNPVALSDNDYTSPFSWSSSSDPNGSTNNFIRYFKPNGSWKLPSPWLVVDPFQVTYSMNFNFSGVSSGFTRNLTKL